jgi:hypothetical protein
MADIPTIPKLWGDLRLAQLHITGASFEKRETSTGPIMAPTHLTIGNKSQRWSLDISDAFETDKHGKRLTPGPASTPPAIPLAEVEADRLKWSREADRRGGIIIELEAKLRDGDKFYLSEIKRLEIRSLQLQNDLEAERKLSADRLVAFDLANTELNKLKLPCPMKDKYPDCEARFDAVEACAADGVVCPRQVPPKKEAP